MPALAHRNRSGGTPGDPWVEAVLSVGIPEYWHRYDIPNTETIIPNLGGPGPEDGQFVVKPFGGSFNGLFQEPGPTGPTNAMKFNGQGYTVNEAGSGFLMPQGQSGSWVIMMRVDPSTTGNGDYLGGKAEQQDEESIQLTVGVEAGPSFFIYINKANADGNDVAWGGSIDLGTGWRLVTVLQGSSLGEEPRMYIDETEDTNLTYFGSGATPNEYWFGDFAGTGFGLGARIEVDTSAKYNGWIDEHLYYPDRILTPAEISTLFQGSGI